MKQTKHILLMAAMLLSSLSVSAESIEIDGTCGDNLTWTLTSKGELIIEGAGAMHEYYEVYPWSEHTESIQTISIKEGVTSIGAWAFSNCSNLTSITIPESVTSIGDGAFDDCSNLTSIFIPKGVSSIGLWAFVSCSSLNSIIVAETNTNYDSRKNCNAIIETNSNKLILGCAATVIPGSVTTIGNAAFCGCTSLVNITIPENVTNIEEGAFVDCTSLNTVVMLSKNLSNIGSEAFAYCDKLSGIYCHSTSVPSAENDAFDGSYPENITLHVPANAIDNYKNTKPWSSFGTIIAISTGNIASGTCGDNLTWVLTDKGELILDGIGAMNKYNEGYPWSVHIKSIQTINIKEGITSIENSAFSGCTSLTTITIPEGVTSIGSYTFSGCTSLTTITLPESVTSIRSGAFYGCSSLTAITIPENSKLTSIGDYAFFNCRSITAITLPEGVTSIGYSTFEGCSKLATVNIPNSVTSIGSDAFYYCNCLTAITIPESVTYIGSYAFNGCRSLTAINIPASVTNIGTGAFSGCNLTAVYINDIAAWCNIEFSNYTSNPLYYAKNLYLNGELVTELTIPNSITVIQNDAFVGCSSLTAINIPKGVTTIGNEAFTHCSSLTSINIPEGVTFIGYAAFGACSSLTTITIPESVTNIGELAFGHCPELLDVYCYAKTMPTTVSDAFDNSNIEKATLHVPASSLKEYQTTAPWSGFGTIVTIGECATPTINYVDGQIFLACETEGVEYRTSVVAENKLSYQEETFEFVPTYTFKAYAIKDKYKDSDVATLTLCWFPCTKEHENEENEILTIPSKPVLIQSNEGIVTLSGLTEGIEVVVYDTVGHKVASTVAADDTVTIDTQLAVGTSVIINIGGYSVKVIIK